MRDHLSGLVDAQRASSMSRSNPAMLCPTSTSGSTLAMCASTLDSRARSLDSVYRLAATLGPRPEMAARRPAGSGWSGDSGRTTVRADSRPGASLVGPSILTARCVTTDTATISCVCVLAPTAVLVARHAITSSGVGSGTASRRATEPGSAPATGSAPTRTTSLGVGTLTSNAHHDADTGSGTTFSRRSQQGPMMSRLSRKCSRHAVCAPNTRLNVLPVRSAGSGGILASNTTFRYLASPRGTSASSNA